MKEKRCQVCKKKFAPERPYQRVCGVTCSAQKGKLMREKAQRAEIRKRRESLKTVGDHLKETQVVFNRFIRLRDRDQPCISCQRHHTGQYHAGHYRPRGMNSGLRFSELNCHKQCSACNNHKSGNLTQYRENLIEKIGLPMVEWLDAHHEIKKWTIEEARELKQYYKEQIKRLEQDL